MIKCSIQTTLTFKNTTIPIPFPLNDTEKVTDGYFGNMVMLGNTIYSVLYIQFGEEPQNFLYAFDTSLNFQGENELLLIFVHTIKLEREKKDGQT